jgi:hypothetical protein
MTPFYRPRTIRSVPEEGVLSIATRGLTWFDWVWQATVLALSPLVILMGTVLSWPPYPIDFYPRLCVMVGIIVVSDLIVEDRVSVRRVDIDKEGMTFHYLFHSEHAAWNELSPADVPVEHGAWFIQRYRRRAGRAPPRGYRVTLEQARAILSYPGRPSWDIPPDVSRSLNLDMKAAGG